MTLGTAIYQVQVDWDNNGSFADANEDITADVKEIRFSRGKEEELAKADTGVLEIRVRNDDNKYSPKNTSSPLYEKLLPKRPIQVRTTAPIVGTAFYGYIETITPHPHWQEKDAFISAVDGLDHLSRHELDTILHQNITTGTAVIHILESAGWPGAKRSVDAGQDTIPFAYWHKVKARTALEDIENSELGFVYVDGSGNLVYEDRHHRYSAIHQTSQYTFDDAMANITFDYSAKNIYNEIRATVTPWELQSEAELWRLEEIPNIPAGATRTWWGNFEYFGSALVTPVGTTDYAASLTAGTGIDQTHNISMAFTGFAKSGKFQVTNNGGQAVYLTLLKVRGTYYDDKTKVTRKSEDATSQATYQKRTLEIDGKFLTDADTAQDYCDYAVGRFKDPQGEVTMTIYNSGTALLSQILLREVSDRITVQNTELSLDEDFFINKMEHEITQAGKVHRCTYYLAGAENEEFWCLGYTGLGDAGCKLAY